MDLNLITPFRTDALELQEKGYRLFSTCLISITDVLRALSSQDRSLLLLRDVWGILLSRIISLLWASFALLPLCNTWRGCTDRVSIKANSAKVLVVLDVLCYCVVGFKFV